MDKILTVDDLDRVFFRAQDEQGKWGAISAKDATDAQFQTWAESRIPIQGENASWGQEERADFCHTLYQQERGMKRLLAIARTVYIAFVIGLFVAAILLALLGTMAVYNAR